MLESAADLLLLCLTLTFSLVYHFNLKAPRKPCRRSLNLISFEILPFLRIILHNSEIQSSIFITYCIIRICIIHV
jgi:hypothetical protein